MVNIVIAGANIGVFLINVALIYFIYRQVRHIYRPIITIKVIERKKDVQERPSVLEFGDLYLAISNVAKNPAEKLKIQYGFFLKNRKITEINKTLRYLNPGEATKEPIELGKILKDYPDLFQEVTRGNTTKKIPKKTLRLLLEVTVTYNYPRYKIYDSYEIEWDSLENVPDFENHPSIFCWNRRDETYIYKLSEFH
jgi:hypothetical protein